MSFAYKIFNAFCSPAVYFSSPRILKPAFILMKFLMFINNVFLFPQSNESVCLFSLIVILPLSLFLAKIEQKRNMTYVSGVFIKSYFFYAATLFPSHNVTKKFISSPWKGSLPYRSYAYFLQWKNERCPPQFFCHWLTLVLPQKIFPILFLVPSVSQ